MNVSFIRIVLHGGLGNQLFQYFIGCLESRRREAAGLLLVSDFLSSYETSRDVELQPLLKTSSVHQVRITHADAVIHTRLPKIVRRLTGKEFIPFIPGYGVIVDGYFQWARSYRVYSHDHINAELNSWRQALAELLQPQAPTHQHVTHIRLGDFFKSTKQARAFASAQLQSLPGPMDLVTDQEEVLNEELVRLNLPFKVQVVPTGPMSAWELLGLLSRYGRITTNGSSLAFWAAILSNADFESSNTEHIRIWRLLTT